MNNIAAKWPTPSVRRVSKSLLFAWTVPRPSHNISVSVAIAHPWYPFVCSFPPSLTIHIWSWHCIWVWSCWFVFFLFIFVSSRCSHGFNFDKYSLKLLGCDCLLFIFVARSVGTVQNKRSSLLEISVMGVPIFGLVHWCFSYLKHMYVRFSSSKKCLCQLLSLRVYKNPL